MGRTKKVDASRALPLLELAANSHQVKEYLQGMLAMAKEPPGLVWRGLMATPPASLVDVVVSEFQAKTDIPLEVPFFTLFHVLAGWMLNSGVRIDVPGAARPLRPDIWTIILASSGSSKTLAKDLLMGALALEDVEFEGTGIASGAKFVEELSKNNHRLWVRDEFAQLLKLMNQPAGPMADLKDYILRLYDNQTLRRDTKKETICVEEAALCILGLTVWETFPQYVSTEDMADGFAQRFSYIIARRDPARPMLKYPHYNLDTRSWRRMWETIVAKVPANATYQAGDDAIEAYKTTFQTLYRDGVPESFYRRILWKSHKYAAIYHVLRGRGDVEYLDQEDYGWAGRALSLHLQDALDLLRCHGLSDLEKICQAAEALRTKATADGKRLTTRDLVSGVRAIKTAGQARDVLSLIGESWR